MRLAMLTYALFVIMYHVNKPPRCLLKAVAVFLTMASGVSLRDN